MLVCVLLLLQVCDTIVTTVPKSVVHCLVRKAEKNLLNHMFGHVHKMSEAEIERMLQVSNHPQLPPGCGVLWHLSRFLLAQKSCLNERHRASTDAGAARPGRARALLSSVLLLNVYLTLLCILHCRRTRV